MARTRRGRNEGSVYQRESDGRWVGSVSSGYGSDGKRRRITVYGDTKREALDRLKDASRRATGPAAAERITVAQYLARWLALGESTLARKTHGRYEGIVDNHLDPYIGGLRLDKLTSLHIQEMFAAQERAGASASTQHKAAVVLGIALRQAVRLGLILGNPMDRVTKPKSKPAEMQVWSPPQARKFLTACQGDRLEALYVLALTTGMRQGELFGLAWADVDFDAGCLSVRRSLEDLNGELRLKETKSAKGRRRIDLPKLTLDALHEHRKRMLAEGHGAAPVFCDTDGGHLRGPNVTRRSFAPLMKRAGLPRIRFHDLRHTAATCLLLAGENPKVVQERLGHAKVQITLDTYSHVLPTMQAAAAERLQKLFG